MIHVHVEAVKNINSVVAENKMRILIAYASKSGTTEKAAKLLSRRFNDVTLRDLTVGSPNPDPYDAVIVGSSIRMGSLHKDARKWLEDNWDVIKTKKFGCFICNGFVDQVPQLLQQNFSQEFLDKAVCVESFGGELDEKKLRGIDLIITKLVMRANQVGTDTFVPCIRTDRIEVMADKFLRLEE